MAMGIASDSFPDLKELENKIGRKTPESLLVWMRDAVDCEDAWTTDVDEGPDHHDSFSEKIKNLKLEMKCLRRADVRILRQLVAVHEGMEALRWLTEERGTLASCGSSLTGSQSSLAGSQSSLATVVDACPSVTPSRCSPVSACLQDDPPDEEESVVAAPDSHVDISNHRRHFPKMTSEGHIDRLTPHSQHYSSASPTRDIKKSAEPIMKALDRSMRKILKGSASDGLPSPNQTGETQAYTGIANESLQRGRGKDMTGDEQSMLSAEKALFGYDAQWCWVESQDDVTFL